MTDVSCGQSTGRRRSTSRVLRMPRRSLTAVAGLLLLGLTTTLVGCSDTTRLPDPTPEATADPLFASDEEALAAAVEVYERYLRVSGEILADAGANPERLEPLVSPDVYADELEGFNQAASNNYRLVGQSTITESEFQQRGPGAEPGDEEVITYFCVSRAGTDVVDEAGNSIVNPDAPVEYAFEVVTVFSDGEAVIESKLLWDGLESCGE